MHYRSKSAPIPPRRASVKRTVRTLLSVEQFTLAIERESLRVHRKSAGDLTLVLFRVARPGNRRLSSMRLARTILKRIRVTDDVGWFDRHHLGMILPDTTAISAGQLARGICSVLARHGTQPLFTIYACPATKASASESGPKMKVAS